MGFDNINLRNGEIACAGQADIMFALVISKIKRNLIPRRLNLSKAFPRLAKVGSSNQMNRMAKN